MREAVGCGTRDNSQRPHRGHGQHRTGDHRRRGNHDRDLRRAISPATESSSKVSECSMVAAILVGRDHTSGALVPRSFGMPRATANWWCPAAWRGACHGLQSKDPTSRLREPPRRRGEGPRPGDQRRRKRKARHRNQPHDNQTPKEHYSAKKVFAGFPIGCWEVVAQFSLTRRRISAPRPNG